MTCSVTRVRGTHISLSLQRASSLKKWCFSQLGSRPRRHRKDGHCPTLKGPGHRAGRGVLFLPAGKLLTDDKGRVGTGICPTPTTCRAASSQEQPSQSQNKTEQGQRLKVQLRSQTSSGPRARATKSPHSPLKLGSLSFCPAGPGYNRSLGKGGSARPLWDRRKAGRGFPVGTPELSGGCP